MTEQRIDLGGVGNARELGGYRIGDRRVRRGALLRSAGLDRATPEALEALQSRYRVQTVVDLRMSAERSLLPDPVIPGAVNLHLPVIEMEDMLADADPSLVALYSDPNTDRMTLFNAVYESGVMNERLYVDFLLGERGRRAFRGFFGALLALEEGRALLWHCTDGKDRTGCAAMLTLFALGADRKTVLADYLLTNACNAQRLEALRRRVAPLGMPAEKVEALLFMSGGVIEGYMTAAIDALEREFGGVAGYLAQIGVGEEETGALRRRLLIEA